MRVQGIALKCVITIEVILYKYSRQKPGPHQKQPQNKITTMLMHINEISWKSWAEAPIKIARMILTIKLDGNWSSFQPANSAPPLSVTDSAIAPSARMLSLMLPRQPTQSSNFSGRSPERNLAQGGWNPEMFARIPQRPRADLNRNRWIQSPEC